MLKQYAILSNCIFELKQSHLPLQDKLKLEIKLIQAKRLLLQDEVEAGVRGVPWSEAEFRDLYGQFQQACSTGTEATQLTMRLNKMMDGLRTYQHGRPPEPSAARFQRH